jgi:D-glycero-alpha-D-manno-heptose-7-phosphate kinase
MTYYSKAPLRIGLAGGGTDVSPYSNLFGGAVVNATISLFANASIQLLDEDKIIIEALDRNEIQEFNCSNQLPINGTLDLLKGVYNRIKKDYTIPTKGFRLSTSVDAPAGSGLGTSSTLVVAVLGAFKQMLHLSLSPYQTAQYAYDIERTDLQLTGGKQDQYAATFGGINFMEFYKDDSVKVNPLSIATTYLKELENNLVLYYTAISRESSNIIPEQVNNVINKNEKSITAMHHLKDQSIMMQNALLNGQLDEIGRLLDYGFTQKKLMANNISNTSIETIYTAAKNAGATGGKISGAGGGGFMIFYCPNNSRNAVINTLLGFGGQVKEFSFVEKGLITWEI